MSKQKYEISFRCYYDGHYCQHYQNLTTAEIGKWIDAYMYTHPEVQRISACMWPKDINAQDKNE